MLVKLNSGKKTNKFYEVCETESHNPTVLSHHSMSCKSYVSLKEIYTYKIMANKEMQANLPYFFNLGIKFTLFYHKLRPNRWKFSKKNVSAGWNCFMKEQNEHIPRVACPLSITAHSPSCLLNNNLIRQAVSRKWKRHCVFPQCLIIKTK